MISGSIEPLSVRRGMTALDLVGAGPAPLAAAAGPGARRAADRRVALIVQRVVGQVVARDVAQTSLLGPVGERVELPEAACLSCRRARRAARVGDCSRRMPGDPGVGARQRSLAAASTFAALQQSLGPPVHGAAATRPATSTSTPKRSSNALPGLEGLAEEDAGVDREHARRAAQLARAVSTSTDSSFWNEQASTSIAWRSTARGRVGQRWTGRASSRPRTRPRRARPRTGTFLRPVDEVVHVLEAELGRHARGP